MKTLVVNLLRDALTRLPELSKASIDLELATTVERTRDPDHGHFASNVALRLAKPAQRNPRDLARAIADCLPQSELVAKTDIAGPGFINFHLSDAAFHAELGTILEQRQQYGRQTRQDAPRILLEFISANPTGPLHVGHGRHAAFGASLGNLLDAAGFPVFREYYINDAGRQMDILGLSVWLRWLEARGTVIPFPEAGYRGDYIRDIAARIDTSGVTVVDIATLLAGIPPDAPGGDKETHVAALIGRARQLLGEERFHYIRQQSLEDICRDIEDDLRGFGVTFDRWYSEQSLDRDGLIDAALAVLDERGMLYRKDGATWFRATEFGDEKDRVVIRENGVKTYFASDIAYHYDKRQRGFDYLIDVLGADHHGYVARVRAGLRAMGYEGDDLEVELVQFVALYRGEKKLAMSTRAGQFVTLRQLREEVGNDAARFFYVMRSNDQHLDFDLELAKSRSSDNPVYYIQYAHARIASVFRQLAEKGHSWDVDSGKRNLGLLTETHEKDLMSALSRYPEVIDLAAANRAPQTLVHYLRDLANVFHTYYNAHVFIVDNAALRDARLTLIAATQVVVANGLGILGVTAPDSM